MKIKQKKYVQTKTRLHQQSKRKRYCAKLAFHEVYSPTLYHYAFDRTIYSNFLQISSNTRKNEKHSIQDIRKDKKYF